MLTWHPVTQLNQKQVFKLHLLTNITKTQSYISTTSFAKLCFVNQTPTKRPTTNTVQYFAASLSTSKHVCCFKLQREQYEITNVKYEYG